jgi:hypothetical protein
MVSLVVSYKPNVSNFFSYCVWVFLLSSLFIIFCLMLLLLAQCCYSYCYSLLDVTVFLLTLAWCSLLDTTTPCSTTLLLLLHLSQRCCSSYYSLLHIVAPLATLRLMVLPLARHYYSSYCSFYYSLFNDVTHLATPCLTLFFFYYPLFDIIDPLVAPWLSFLFNVPWSMLLFLYSFILNMVCSNTFLLCCDVLAPLLLLQCYYSYSSYSRLVFPPLIFCRCGRNSPNSNFQAILKRWNFFSTFVCWWIFLLSMSFFGNFGW